MLRSKSAILTSLANWEYDEVRISDPSENEVLVKVIQSGICSTDIIRSMKVGFYNYPIIPGHEIIGKIYKLGKCSFKHDFYEGDKVCVYPLITKCTSQYCCGHSHSIYGYKKNPNVCSDYDFLGSRSHGGYSEYLKAPIKNLIKIPENLDDDLSVFTEPSAVALHAFKIASSDRKFDSVIISGLGPIGILIASWCKKFKINNIIGIDRNEHRFYNFQNLGCKKIINTKKDNVLEKIKEYTNNDFAEVSFECSGSEDLLNSSIMSLKKGGKCVILSNQINKVNLSIELLNKILRQEITISGSWSSVIEPHNEWEESLDFLKNNKDIVNLISHKFNFSDAKKIFFELYNKKFKFSKVILKP